MNLPTRKQFCAICAATMTTLAGIFAQSNLQPQGLTAQEYLDRASALYLDTKYQEAAAMYEKFAADYGQSTEALPILHAIRYRHAMCYIHMRKFSESLDKIEAALQEQPPLPQNEIQELKFWLGVANIEEKNYPVARDALEKFIALFPAGAERNPLYVQQHPAARSIPEARMLIGSAWLLEGQFHKAAEHYAALKPNMLASDRGRVVILQLYALLNDHNDEAAMKVIAEEYAYMADLAQIITFQTLTLELGNRLLEKGEYRKAIICLQRVWTSNRLLKHQQARLEDLEARLQAAESNPRSDPYTKLTLGQLIQNVKREIENFQKITSFDAALRLRLASAYQAMNRHLEASLILEDMLHRMPPDKIVEQASANLVQSWFEAERWPKVSESAQAFIKIFPQSPSIPLVLYLEGMAEQKDNRYTEALASFESILKQYPASDIAPRAMFMKGFTLLLAEKNKEAIATFEEFPNKYPKHELVESALYWRGMAYSLDKQFAKCRDVMDEYLGHYPSGQFAGNAVFRKAYCAQQLEDYATSTKELRSFMRTYPGHEESSEARVLLGDALMNEGQMQEGIANFRGIPKSDTRFYEEGIFKVGKAYKLMEETEKYLALMEEFKAGSPRSPRVAEAIYNIGAVHRQNGRPEKAREIYWDAIKQYGDDPDIRSVDDLFPALAKLYKGPEESAQYLALLHDQAEEARKSGKKTLAMRATWAQGYALKKTDPARAQNLMVVASADANVQTTNPLLLADFAEAMFATGREKDGEQMYREMVKWNPRAPQKDRALAALGNLELKRGNESAALALFDRFQRETIGSLISGQVLLSKAQLLQARGQSTEARKTLETLLANQYSSGKEKAEALCRIGDIYMAENKPQLAIPYYQRIYVMHGRWRDWVAKAYLRSGEAFEKLEDPTSARKTYQELSEKEDFAELPETIKAKERLNALGGPLAELTPTQG